jgi:WD40 repeat protein
LFDTPNITNSIVVSGGQSLISYDQILWTGAPDEPTVVKIWNIPGGEVVHQMELRINTQGVYASSDGRMIGTVRGSCPSETSKCTLEIRDTSTGEILLSIEEDSVQGVTFSPDDRYFAFSGLQGIQLWDIAGKQLVKTLTEPSSDDFIRFSHNGKYLAASTYLGLYVRVWDLETGTQLAEITSEKYEPIFYFSTMAFSPDDNSLAICINGIVDLYDTKTWSEGESWEWHQAPITAIAYSPDGRLMATGAVDGSIVLGTSAGQKLADLSGHTSYIKQLLFSSDGNWLMSTSLDGTLRYWGVPAE